MIQLYQRTLLQQLTGNSPLSSFFTQPTLPPYFSLPKINTMSSISSLTSALVQQRTVHNPDNVASTSLPKDFRFLFTDELRDTTLMPKALLWVPDERVFGYPQEARNKYDERYSYAVPVVDKNKSPVDAAIDALQDISVKRADAPTLADVRAEMNQLVTRVEAPLREEIKDARHGCKRLSETVDRQRTKIAELEAKNKQAEDRISNLSTAYAEKSATCDKMRKNARGNLVLLRRDGFSKPMSISPVYGFSMTPELPRHIEFHDMPEFPTSLRDAGEPFAKVTYRTFRAVNTGKQDGFGRTIFEQV